MLCKFVPECNQNRDEQCIALPVSNQGRREVGRQRVATVLTDQVESTTLLKLGRDLGGAEDEEGGSSLFKRFDHGCPLSFSINLRKLPKELRKKNESEAIPVCFPCFLFVLTVKWRD